MLGRLFRRNEARDQKASQRYRHGNDYLIELRQVVKDYETPAGPFRALRGIDLKIGEGEFVGVIGKSGSGKSTLINMIAGIDRPTAGEVLVGDTAVHTLSEGDMAVWRGRNLGIVFQFFQLLPTLSLVDNIMLPMDFGNVYPMREARERAMHLLDQVGMIDHAHKLPSAISGGQQQRVAIARALANDPPIVVADEPTGNLDSKTAETVFDLFDELVKRGKTILMVTHDHDLAKRVTRTIVLSDGEIIEEYLSRAFPSLSEAQLIWATRRLEPQRYPPGALIIRRGDPADKLYVITKGQVDVFIGERFDQEMHVASMGKGQYFGEIELVRGGERIASVRAAEHVGVEVVTIDRETFQRMIGESQPTLQEVQKVALERVAENEAARGR